MVRIEYIRVFNQSKSYQLTCADVEDNATDLQIIEHLLHCEDADISLARIMRPSGVNVNVDHPRCLPTWNHWGYVSRINWVLSQDPLSVF